MALSDADIVTIAEITREFYTTIADLVIDLTAAQEASLEAEIITWNEGTSPLRDAHVRLLGGKDGIDLDNERKREAIRMRVRKMLGLSLVSDEWLALDPNTMQLIQFEVGQNFG